METEAVFDALTTEEPLVNFSAIAWMNDNGADPRRIVSDAIERLRSRGRSLPREQRVRYARQVLLGEFFARWAAKNGRKKVADLCDDKDQLAAEMHPFELALMAAADERAFKRLTPLFSRKRIVEHVGLSIGTPDDFAGFVTENTRTLAAQFLKNFDSTRPGAARNAVRYIQKTAVSWYLIRRTKPIRTDAPNLEAYLAGSKRLDERTILAVKLAYLPALLTQAELRILRERYGFTGGIGERLPINDLAARLGFKNPAVLSRKLYRVRAWCRRSAPPPPPPAGTEVQS
jgi:AraC-like DNA-binding protein